MTTADRTRRPGTGAGDRGELAILLHSHMPYVEGFGTWPFGEEWLFEAMATAYLPLLELLAPLAVDGEREALTIGITPVLADQLALPDVGERFLRFLHDVREEAHRIDIRSLERAGEPLAADALRRSDGAYRSQAEAFERRGGDILAALRRLEENGAIELWTGPASHAVLPLIATEQGLRLQLLTGIDSHRQRFGRWSGGLWLPECAYREGLDDQLGAAGVVAFCVDQTSPGESLDQLEPVVTAGGPIAFPIDWRTIELVWDERGYPADPVYRDYHALSRSGLRPYANDGSPYRPDAARARARAHGAHFVARVRQRLERYQAERREPGLVVCALDTELLGHWWHEGVEWLAAVLEEARAAGLALTGLTNALERHEPRRRSLRESSWGTPKDLSTWDSPQVADLVWPARESELALVRTLLRAGANGGPGKGGASLPRSAERAARELLALQASDWAFMAARELAGDYPRQRVVGHAAGFGRALAELLADMKDSPSVRRATSFRAPQAMPAGGREAGSADAPGNEEGRLRGLAPGLRLSSLLEPPSPWGRE